MPSIRSASSQLSIAYRLNLDGVGERRYWVSIISQSQLQYVLPGTMPESVLVVALIPKSLPATFIRGQRFDPTYVTAQTGLEPFEAGLLSAILPLLTRMVLPEDVVMAAQNYVNQQRTARQ